MREEIIGQDKDHLIRQGNKNNTSEAKAIACHLPPGESCPASLQATATLGTTTTTPPASPTLPTLLLLSIALYVIEYPFGQLGQLSQLSPPPNLLPTLNLLSGMDRIRDRGGLDTMQALFSGS